MTMTIEVEIDDSGTVRPMDPAASLPRAACVAGGDIAQVTAIAPSLQDGDC